MTTPNTAISIRLSPGDLKKFRASEKQIDADLVLAIKHQESAIRYVKRIGEKLHRIKQAGWYQVEAGTWPAYLAQRFPRLKKTQANHYITVAGILKDLWGEGSAAGCPSGEEPGIKTVLPLAKLDPSVRADAYEAAKEEPDKAPTSERVKSVVARLLETEDPEEQQRLAREEKERIVREGRDVESRRADDDRTRRWRKILASARLARKDARGLGHEAEDVIEWQENTIRRACDELGEDPYKHGLGREEAA